MAPLSAQPTILVVEDDASLRQFYRTALTNAGYYVITRADGLDALRWIEENTPSLIVLDLSLVCVSGRDFQKELHARADTRDIPIVVVTGDNTSDLITSEFACVLHKPITDVGLIDAVRRCLSARRGR